MIRLTSLPLLPLRGASGHVCLRCRVAAYSRVSTRPGSITLPTARHGIRAASSKAKPKAKPASARPKAAAKQDVKRKRSSAAKSGAAKKHATKQQPAQTPWPLPLRKEKPLQKPIGATIGSMGRSLEAALSRNKPGLPSASKSIEADALAIETIPAPRPPVPSLAHGLDRVLFNPGIMHFKDPRSGVYNVDPGLEEMMPIRDFNFDSLVLFVPPSRDMVLAKIAKEVEKRYVASTSSLTGVLKHFHFLLSRFRRPNVETVSKSFPIAHEVTYSKISHAPDAVFLRYRDGMYAVDADKEFDRGNILSLMGRLMEKLLTVDPARFERHRRDTADPISEEEMSEPEAYHYSVAGEFLLRSQLDAHDPRLPGSGMFDLKTRAVVPIRMDVEDFEWGMKYEIRGLYGQWQSFEREYYDMIRSTILKYSLQARMGRMDGIFVAYHNIARIFGFQYISLAEMDAVIHGQSDTSLGDQEFLVSMQMLSDVVNRAVKKYPNQSLRFHFEARETVNPFLYAFAEPIDEAKVEEIQSTNRQKIKEWEESVLSGNTRSDATRELEPEADKLAETAAAADVEAEQTSRLIDSGDEAAGASATQDKSPDASASGVHGTQSQEAPGAQEQAEESAESADASFLEDLGPSAESEGPLLAMKVTANSFVDKHPVSRPSSITKKSRWRVEYEVEELPEDGTNWILYNACKERRHKTHIHVGDVDGLDEKPQNFFYQMLRRMADDGRKWRESQKPTSEKPLMWNDRPEKSGEEASP